MDIMTITERHQTILKKLKRHGAVSVKALKEEFDVSAVTIRKDLRALEDKKLLFRTHGGASLKNPYTSNQSIREKKAHQPRQKKAIARAAQSLIGETDSIILGSGTTVTAFAKQLEAPHELNIITSALNISLIAAEKPNINVIQLGGTLRESSASVVGDYAECFFEEVTCGVLFLGVDGIDLDFGLTTTNLGEAKLNQRSIDVAQIVVVLADSSKFGKRGFGRICDLSDVHHIVTDDGVCPETVQELENHGVQVTIAPIS